MALYFLKVGKESTAPTADLQGRGEEGREGGNFVDWEWYLGTLVTASLGVQS